MSCNTAYCTSPSRHSPSPCLNIFTLASPSPRHHLVFTLPFTFTSPSPYLHLSFTSPSPYLSPHLPPLSFTSPFTFTSHFCLARPPPRFTSASCMVWPDPFLQIQCSYRDSRPHTLQTPSKSRQGNGMHGCTALLCNGYTLVHGGVMVTLLCMVVRWLPLVYGNVMVTLLCMVL
jgi:hypothetical protein